jgi:hypothetical protein
MSPAKVDLLPTSSNGLGHEFPRTALLAAGDGTRLAAAEWRMRRSILQTISIAALRLKG